jgi:hypothetical protein
MLGAQGVNWITSRVSGRTADELWKDVAMHRQIEWHCCDLDLDAVALL